jgi:tRNA (adenine22-N1)-methyltransferase
MRLSKRLEVCVSFTDGFLNLADIGTDHAQLPIAAIQRGYVSKAQAIDNKYGPYVTAFSTVKKWEMEQKIKVILGDGLEKIEDDTDVCVIAGMGGDLIRDILTAHSTKNIKRFILQPNKDAFKIRSMLTDINFKIKDELVLEEQNKIYDVMILERGNEDLTEDEILYGPVNIKQKPFYFLKKMNQEIIRTEFILSQKTDDTDRQILEHKLAKLKELLQ